MAPCHYYHKIRQKRWLAYFSITHERIMCKVYTSHENLFITRIKRWHYGSFRFIANTNSLARCEWFYLFTVLDTLLKFDASTRSELASWYCDEWKRGLSLTIVWILERRQAFKILDHCHFSFLLKLIAITDHVIWIWLTKFHWLFNNHVIWNGLIYMQVEEVYKLDNNWIIAWAFSPQWKLKRCQR